MRCTHNGPRVISTALLTTCQQAVAKASVPIANVTCDKRKDGTPTSCANTAINAAESSRLTKKLS